MRPLSVVSITLLASSALFAQSDPGKTSLPLRYYPNAELRQYLNLTETQANLLDENQRKRSDAEQAIYTQINDKWTTIHTLLSAGSKDAARIGQLMVDVADLQKQLPLSGDPYRSTALAVLTDPQKAKLPELKNALVVATPAWQAVTWNLIDSPNPIRIQPAFTTGASGVTTLPFPVPPNHRSIRQ